MSETEEVKDDFSRYTIFGDISYDDVRELHKLVVEYKERLFEDHILQDVLLNNGFELEDRPKNWFDVNLGCWNRRKILMHLSFLEMMLDLVSKPRLVVVKSPLIIVPGQEQKTEIETPEGWDAEKVECFQKEWLKNSEISRAVRSYQEQLGLAFDEYNSQTMLLLMQDCLKSFIDPSWKRERKHQEKIGEVLTPKSYEAMDSAYYNMGNRNFRAAGGLWDYLSKSEFGRHFVMTIEEESQALKSR